MYRHQTFSSLVPGQSFPSGQGHTADISLVWQAQWLPLEGAIVAGWRQGILASSQGFSFPAPQFSLCLSPQAGLAGGTSGYDLSGTRGHLPSHFIGLFCSDHSHRQEVGPSLHPRCPVGPCAGDIPLDHHFQKAGSVPDQTEVVLLAVPRKLTFR